MAERMVTRKVIEHKVLNVYELKDGSIKFLGEETVQGKVSEKELAKKYNVDKVVTDVKEEHTAVYGVPVSQFMEIAVKLEQ